MEPATNWPSVLVPTVLAIIHMEQGQVKVSKSMLSNKIGRACSVWLAHLRLNCGNKSEAPYTTWMAYFSQHHVAISVIDESEIMRPHKKQQSLEFYKHSNGHHPIKDYSRVLPCGTCVSTNQNTNKYMHGGN